MEKTSPGTVLGVTPLVADYFLLHLELSDAPEIAPGNSLRISGKPYGVMRSHPRRGSIEMLGKGTLPQWTNGERLEYQLDTSAFNIQQGESRFLLIGEELGTAQIIFLAERLKRQYQTGITALLGFNTQMPFRAAPSQIMMPALPPHVIACVPLLEEWGIASRIANTNAMPGCYEGSLQTLVSRWLDRQKESEKIRIFICASRETSRAITKLAGEQPLSCQTIEY